MAHATRVNKIKHHIWGPTGSIFAHLILVLLLMTFVRTVHERAPENEIFIALDDHHPVIKMDDIIDCHIDQSADLNFDLVRMPALETTEVKLDAPQESEVSHDRLDLQALTLPDIGVVKIACSIGSRNNRKQLLHQHARGFAKLTEPAVIRALEWLMKNQHADGSWNASMRMGHTGLALLTFLAHGETPSSRRYGPTIEKAMRYLMSQTDDANRFKINQSSHAGIYEHCIATYAITEAFSLTRIPDLKPIMNANLQVIIDGQQAGGGWDYGFADQDRTDTSIMGWAVQALKAGKLAGAASSGIQQALEQALPAFSTMAKMSTGRFGYTQPGQGDIGMTGVGILSLQLLGAAGSPQASRGLEALRPIQASYSGVSKHPLYAYYYITQARFQAGGEIWTEWNPKIATLLVKSQAKDGSWQAGEEGERRGKVYSTTLAALTLQVYYRYLPTTQQIAVKALEVAADDVDIIITVGDG